MGMLVKNYLNNTNDLVIKHLTSDYIKEALVSSDGKSFVGMVVDVETTGLDVKKDVVIELCTQKFTFNNDCQITSIDNPKIYYHNPGKPLDKEIIRITGLTNEFLESNDSLSDSFEEIEQDMEDVRFIIAHHAYFDRNMLENTHEVFRKPIIWGCTRADVDWNKLGIPSSALDYLTYQYGVWFDHHKAENDVLATLFLLTRILPDGTHTVLKEILKKAMKPEFVIEATKAPFSVKDDLKENGYFWFADKKVWSKKVNSEEEMENEKTFLKALYRGTPTIEKRSNKERFLVS